MTQRDLSAKSAVSAFCLCFYCGASYQTDDPALRVRHRYKFCITNPGWRKPKSKEKVK